jgi:hypothetical protein
MALSSPARAFLWGDGLTVAGQDLRLQTTSAMLASTMAGGSTGIQARQGVRPSGLVGGGALLVSASSGMSLTVASGMAFVQGTTAANSGMYTASLDTTATITVATSDPTNPRIDNVLVQITDLGSSSSTAVVTLQTGTPAPSPTPPALPANSLLLATVAVAASTSTIVAGNITDARVFTVAQGGILPVASLAPGGAMIGSNGQFAYSTTTRRLVVADGAGNARQVQTGAFGAQSATVASGVATVGATASLLSAPAVTVDGNTELVIYASWGSAAPGASTAIGDFVQIFVFMDGAGGLGASAGTLLKAESTNLNASDGGNMMVWTTPSAGSHTFSIAAQSTGHAFTLNGLFIRVAPSLQQ